MPTETQPPIESPISPIKRKGGLSTKVILIALAVIGGIAILTLTAVIAWYIGRHQTKSTTTQTVQQTPTPQTNQTASTPNPTTTQGITLDTTKNYGNIYANGLLPVGDNKYTTSTPQQGYVYVCNANFVPAGQAGAQTRGPWFVNNNTQWDMNKKISVEGSISWTPSISMNITNGQRIITTNDLPNHKTGIFPIQASDHAHQYDANPNTIKAQSLTYTLNANPTYSNQPNCMGGEVGVMLTGVALFDAFDAGGRDAGAWEIQDSCSGHPQESGEYHYHTLSKCITNIGVGTVIGFALDGYPITGPKISDSNILTTKDLDVCHGITSQIQLDGKTVTMYHYVMTQDFPYSVSCFRSTAAKAPNLPSSGGTQQQGSTQPSGQQMPPPRRQP